MSLRTSKSLYTDLSLSPHLPHRTMTSPAFATHSASPGPFGSRRGNVKFSSGRYSIGRSSGRMRKGPMLSFRSSRRSAPKPARTRAVFASLLNGLEDGVKAVRVCVEEMKKELPKEPSTGSRMNYYMDLEKQVKLLERKMRTLEVHKDRIEEMRDEYILKMKLRDGAFNLAQALASQSSKTAKEKLQELRMEQRDLVEDLCDIEDELETKLGVFKVHINGLVGVSRTPSGELFEVQLKLGSQKWKAKCRVTRQQQIWQDAEIIFLGKIMDELFVKVVEVRRIQGNAHIGTMKCLTRELFSFLPQSLTYNFPNSSSTKLNMDVRWSPMIGEEFLTELDLQKVHCFVGARGARGMLQQSSAFNVERLQVDPQISGVTLDPSVHHIRLLVEPEDTASEPHSRSSYGRQEVRIQTVEKKKKKKRKKEEDDFVFLDRTALMSPNGVKDFPEVKRFVEMDRTPSPITTGCSCHGDSGLGYQDNSLGSSASSSRGSDNGSPSQPSTLRSNESAGVAGMLELVFAALEEPREQFLELRPLDVQLTRLEAALKGGRLTKAPSMTLSESQAMDSFDFLGGGEEASLVARFSQASISSDQVEDPSSAARSSDSGSDQRSLPRPSGSFSRPPGCPPRQPASRKSLNNPSQAPETTEFSQTSFDSQSDEVFATGSSGYQEGSGESCASSTRGESAGTGVDHVDRALVQHLIHCEFLLQNLQSSGPLNYRQSSSLRKLQQEAEVISELLNIAAELTAAVKIDRLLPELAANEQLMSFWKTVAREDLLSVSYEHFAVTLDEKFGQSLWRDFPEVANKVFTEILSRILDLDSDCGPADVRMVVTVFQFSAYFLSQGSSGVHKCMREVAQELKVTEGLADEEARATIAAQLTTCGYNRGALLVSAHFLADESAALRTVSKRYLGKFAGNSPWHSKAVQFFIQLLENSDQVVRTGACIALGELQAKSAAPQLRYLSKGDFTPVRNAAARALAELGETEGGLASGIGKQASSSSLEARAARKKPLARTRSAEYTLSS